eukprot:gnl/MRDRNA2_/MRDRNA2_53307_c0_seq1.p2 gnl/MRDRNA2_/MRDRNA2_53307_c0~~gnl/MRDRNA2_/MRDRNA2_53307_c0_seq1.p2  ORF type:complete len:101 (-),score=0.37 gnl/MRDRNA2_/MRDRNA2_53307_c0_seq1:37-339(-)
MAVKGGFSKNCEQGLSTKFCAIRCWPELQNSMHFRMCLKTAGETPLTFILQKFENSDAESPKCAFSHRKNVHLALNSSAVENAPKRLRQIMSYINVRKVQ